MTYILGNERAKREDGKHSGWIFQTSVKLSKFADNAGNGRFSDENIPNSVVSMTETCVEMADVVSLSDLPPTSTLTFESEEELLEYIDLAVNEGDITKI